MELTCTSCGAGTLQGTDGPSEWTCLTCDRPFSVSLPSATAWEEVVSDRPGVARYGRLLPVKDPALLDSVDAALVPVPSPALARGLGVAEVYLLPQTLNATGTFKDNEGVLIAAKCREWGLTDVCIHSSGNTARAYTHYLSAQDIACTGFVPKASAYKCPDVAPHGTTVVAVDGGMVEAADASIAHADSHGSVRLTPSTWKIEGKVPLGLAIAEHVPHTSVIAVAAASGYGALGMQRAIARASEVGLPTPTGHHFRIVQIADAAALGSAVRSGAETVDMDAMADPSTAYEPTLQSTNPNRTLPLVKDLVASTSSRIDAVTPSQVDDSAAAFVAACAELGIPLDTELERSALICWAGLQAAASAGELDPDAVVTMIVSGSAPLART